MNLAEVFSHHARNRPRHPAIVAGETIVTYRQLDAAVRHMAAKLAGAGVAPGDIVGLCLGDSAGHLILHYAVARMGAVILPMDHRWAEAEKRAVAIGFGAAIVVVEPGAGGLDGVATAVCDDAWTNTPAAAGPGVPVHGDGAAPLLLSLSSGTTGRPKGPLISHRQMYARFVNQWVNLSFNAADRYLSATPLYFGGGRSFCMSFLFAGATVVLFGPPYGPEELLAEVRRCRPTILFVVPTVLRRLLTLEAPPQGLFADLRMLLSSGSAVHPDERQAIFAKLTPNFYDYYGSTEGGGISLADPADQRRHPEAVGRPGLMIEIEVVDDAHRPLPPGEVGRLRYRGPGVATGLYNAGPEDGDSFVDGWFYPGDLARIDDDGYVFLKGRAREVIIRGGVNVYPAEIERALLAHPAVLEAAVIGLPHEELGEEAAAFVVLRGEASQGDLIAHCREQLAAYKVPRRVIAIAKMPKNPTGKILKTALAERLL